MLLICLSFIAVIGAEPFDDAGLMEMSKRRAREGGSKQEMFGSSLDRKKRLMKVMKEFQKGTNDPH